MHHHIHILLEDNHYLILNKPAGILVQPDNSKDPSLVDLAKEYLKKAYNKPGKVFCEAAHRIDRPVSGLIILAKTSKGVERMNELFRLKQIQKTYWAIVEQKPPMQEERLTHWLRKENGRNISKAYDHEAVNSQKAELSYKLLQQLEGNRWLLEVNLHTGRHHQIRLQLSHIGCPILGDVKYRSHRPTGDHCIALHAREIKFAHPISKEAIEIKAPLPDKKYWEGCFEV
ncbi:MAG TPA: RluA family pseudouridine synthase [Cytophagales bacterium]|nr:RluA family pseudouridine synthase [Cytophagales bacterium]